MEDSDRNDRGNDGRMLHERIYRKMKQDNINEGRYLMRREKLIQKEVRFVKSKISMEKKYLADKSMISAAKIRKLEQEDNLIKGKERKKPKQPRGPPHTEKRSRRKRDSDFGRSIKQINFQTQIDDEDDDGKNNIRPPPFLPPLYRQKVVFPQRSLFKPRRNYPVAVEDLYDCRYLRLSKKQQLERDMKN